MKLLTPTEVIESIKNGKQIEWTYGNEEEWYEFEPFDFTVENLLNEYYSFRLAQEMIAIGNVSFPKPESNKEVVEKTGVYYYPDITSPEDPYHLVWENSSKHFNILKSGLLHLNRDGAIAHAKSLIKLSGGIYE